MERGTRVNGLGNTIADSFHMNRERYYYDERLTPSKGWKQYDTDQDAWYFGVWVNVERREIVTYAEGDESLTTCPTLESFKAELDAMGECYGDPPPMAVGIDADGSVTKFYDTRPTAEG